MTTTKTTSDVPTQLQAIEESCHYGPALADTDRRRKLGVIERISAPVIAHILVLAARGEGSVAGIALDPVAANEALARADEAERVATAAAMLARRARDEAIRLRAGVAGQATAVRMYLRGYVKTPQGRALARDSDELRALKRRELGVRKAQKTKARKALAP